MQEVTDNLVDPTNATVLKPFGPSIVKMRMDEKVQSILRGAFDNNTLAPDNSSKLAGNMKREFQLTKELLGPDAQMFVDLLASGSGKLYNTSIQDKWSLLQPTLTVEHSAVIQSNLDTVFPMCQIHDAWGNISVAGDFNPVHGHGGAISGVGYLRMPDNIDDEWAREDHEPSAGMITFIDGRSANMGESNIRIKPQVGDIYFFPAWLLHQVNPFRSSGERWSFSFNTTVHADNPLQLSQEQKLEIKEKIGTRYV